METNRTGASFSIFEVIRRIVEVIIGQVPAQFVKMKSYTVTLPFMASSCMGLFESLMSVVFGTRYSLGRSD